MSDLQDIITINTRLRESNRQAARRLVEAYGWNTPPRTVAPLEQPTAAWVASRDKIETLAGVRVRRHYTE